MEWRGPNTYDYEYPEYADYLGVTHIFEKGKALCNQSGAWAEGRRKCKKCLRILRRKKKLPVTTQELFEKEKITLEMLDERSDESSYWSGCNKFINDKWTSDIDSMTQKQANWMDKILEDMIEWRIKNQ